VLLDATVARSLAVLGRADALAKAVGGLLLKVLHEAGLVDRDNRGVWVYYKIRPQALASLGTLIGCPPR
jgi:DNA-binding transcriptional ArsR family regulator